jgi:hypothetical protein
MAKGYLDALQGIAERTGDVVDRDVKFSETEAFHESALQKNGLDLNNWTLKTPFDLIKQTQGDAAAERIWESLRNTGGTGLDAIAESTWILSRTGKEMTSADPERARRAQEWMDTVPGPANWDQMKRFFDILGKLPVPVPDTDPFTGMPWPTPINDIKKKFDKASTIPSPIILDLDGDGVETAAVGAGAYFDHASDGFAEQTGWAGRDDGLLVRDLNGNGSIDNGTELMGSETLLANGQKAANSFEVLKALDQNNDGRIDTSDAVFADLKVWKDANTITIDFLSDEFRAYVNTGRLEIDLNRLTSALYIDNNGTATKDTAVTAIVHELVHALTGRRDNVPSILSGLTIDYRQSTVTFSNIIYRELGLPEQNSYIAYDTDGILTPKFQYTN